jgi:hypothetical protein
LLPSAIPLKIVAQQWQRNKRVTAIDLARDRFGGSMPSAAVFSIVQSYFQKKGDYANANFDV